jgi:hypothetical protein
MKPPEPKPQPVLVLHRVCQRCGRQSDLSRADIISLSMFGACFICRHPIVRTPRQPLTCLRADIGR